ncbi:MAG: SRPBCC family protein [Burkholderiales bacterium]
MEQAKLKEKPSLSLTRRSNATPEKVWRAWTDPQALKQWFGPDDSKSCWRRSMCGWAAVSTLSSAPATASSTTSAACIGKCKATASWCSPGRGKTPLSAYRW